MQILIALTLTLCHLVSGLKLPMRNDYQFNMPFNLYPFVNSNTAYNPSSPTVMQTHDEPSNGVYEARSLAATNDIPSVKS